MTGLSLEAKQANATDFSDPQPFNQAPALVFSHDHNGHFVIYNPQTLEFLAFDLQFLNRISEIEKNAYEESFESGSNYIYYFTKSTITI